MKSLIILAMTFIAATSQAGYKFLDITAEYECTTDHVFLKTSKGDYLNFKPSVDVVYKPAAEENQNLVIGDYGYLVWVRQLSETEVGLTIFKTIDGQYREIEEVNMGSAPVSSVDREFPLFNSGGEGSAKCKITLKSSPSKKFQ